MRQGSSDYKGRQPWCGIEQRIRESVLEPSGKCRDLEPGPLLRAKMLGPGCCCSQLTALASLSSSWPALYSDPGPTVSMWPVTRRDLTGCQNSVKLQGLQSGGSLSSVQGRDMLVRVPSRFSGVSRCPPDIVCWVLSGRTSTIAPQDWPCQDS